MVGKQVNALQKTERNSCTGAVTLLRQLKVDGVTCMFGNPGSTEENLLQALQSDEFKDLTYYLAFHEGAAAAMADSWARSARKPAILQLHSYAGLSNALGMISYSKRGGSPVVVLCGEAGLKYDALQGQMSADLLELVRPWVKADANGPCAWRAVDRGSIARLLRRAMKAAMTSPKGPVFLALPMDVLDEVNEEQICPSIAIDCRVAPPLSKIEECAESLLGGVNPLILIGDGIAECNAQNEVKRIAELLGASVWGVNSSEVNMPFTHPQFRGLLGHMFGADSKKVTAAADVVLICGTAIMPEVFPETAPIFKEDSTIIQIDLNSYEIGKNHPVSIGCIGDLRYSLESIAEYIEKHLTQQQRVLADKRISELYAAKNNSMSQAIGKDAADSEAPLKAHHFLSQLKRRLADRDVMIFDEALTHSPELLRYFPPERVGSYFQTRAGMLGTGLPGTVGLKVANRDTLVIGFCGDGGSISTIQALATAARYRIGAKFVILNNRSYRILKQNLRAYRLEKNLDPTAPYPECFDLSNPDLRFDKLAQAQGVRAMRIDSKDQISQAIDLILSDDMPCLIDLVIDGSI